MTKVSTKQRSKDVEIMDEFDFRGQQLKEVLKTIDSINTRLGGHRVTIDGVQKLINLKPKTHYTIADLGCGSGDALRQIAVWAKQKGIQLQLIGIDANPYTIEIARAWSSSFKNISYRVVDVFSEDFEEFEADIIISCLTLHHFEDKYIKKLLPILCDKANIGLVVNDLQRNILAYRLFKLYCKVFVNSDIAKKDGLTSILRGFKAEDLERFAEELQLNHQISWYWAFRYQWIIYSS